MDPDPPLIGRRSPAVMVPLAPRTGGPVMHLHALFGTRAPELPACKVGTAALPAPEGQTEMENVRKQSEALRGLRGSKSRPVGVLFTPPPSPCGLPG